MENMRLPDFILGCIVGNTVNLKNINIQKACCLIKAAGFLS